MIGPLLPRLSRLGVPWATAVPFNLLVLATAVQGIHALDTDLFYRLAGGRYMVEQGHVLDREVFSFTIGGTPWTNYSWLFEYTLYRLYALGGFPAVIAFRALLVVLTANLIFYWCHRRAGPSRLVAFAMSLLAFGLYQSRATNIRPHLISYLLLVLTLILVDRMWRREGRFEVWLPILGVLWANFHGVEYPIFLFVLGVHALAALLPHARVPLGALRRDWNLLRWPALVLVCALAVAVNPFGARVFGTALMGLDREVTRHIQEFQPYAWRSVFDLFPQLHLSAGAVFNYTLVLALVAVPDWVRRRDLRAILLVGGASVLAIDSTRFMPEFAILAPGFVAEGLLGLRGETAGRPGWLQAALAGVVVFVLAAGGVTAWSALERGYYRELSPTAYPIGPARFLQRQGLAGNAFSDATISGYVEWALAPRVRVFMDMRTPEPFDAQLYWLYREVVATRDPTRLDALQVRWPIDFVLLRRDAALAQGLARTPGRGFALAYADDGFVLFVHDRVLAGGRDGLALRVLNPFDPGLAYVASLSGPAREALGRETAGLLAVWPGNHLARQTDLALKLSAGAYPDAYETARRLRSEFPGEARYAYAAGLALRGLGRDAAALDEFQRTLRLDPEFGPAYAAAGEAALGAGRYDVGARIMEAYGEQRRQRLTAEEYALLGDLRHRRGRPREAVRAYERALWLAADAGELRARIENNAGSAYLELGEPQAALPHLEAALRARRPFPEAELNRARAWARGGRTAEAREVFRRLAADAALPPDVRTRAQTELAGPAR